MSTFEDSPKLKPKQIKALAALAAGATDGEAARISRCTPPTIAAWRRQPGFSSELDRLLRWQRDRIQAVLGAQVERSRVVVDEALTATDDNGKPLYPIRLRAAELVTGSYERISKRAEEAPPAQTGPLIVLPAGTQRIAVALDMGGGGGSKLELPAPATAAASIDVESIPAEPATAAPASPTPAGLPRWWRGPTLPQR